MKKTVYILLSSILLFNINIYADAVYDFVITQDQCPTYNGVWDGMNSRVCVNNIIRSNNDCISSSINNFKGIWYNFQKNNINTAACIYPGLDSKACIGSGLSFDEIPSCSVSSNFFDQRCITLQGVQKYECTSCYKNNQFWDSTNNVCTTGQTCNSNNLMQFKIEAAVWDQSGQLLLYLFKIVNHCHQF